MKESTTIIFREEKNFFLLFLKVEIKARIKDDWNEKGGYRVTYDFSASR